MDPPNYQLGQKLYYPSKKKYVTIQQIHVDIEGSYYTVVYDDGLGGKREIQVPEGSLCDGEDAEHRDNIQTMRDLMVELDARIAVVESKTREGDGDAFSSERFLSSPCGELCDNYDICNLERWSSNWQEKMEKLLRWLGTERMANQLQLNDLKMELKLEKEQRVKLEKQVEELKKQVELSVGIEPHEPDSTNQQDNTGSDYFIREPNAEHTKRVFEAKPHRPPMKEYASYDMFRKIMNRE